MSDEEIATHIAGCSFCLWRKQGGLTHDMFWGGVGARSEDFGLPPLFIHGAIDALKRTNAAAVGDAG